MLITKRLLIFTAVLLVFLILHIVVHSINFSNELWWSQFSFLGLFITVLVGIVYLTKSFLLKFLRANINVSILPIVRIIYASLSLFSATQHFSLIQYGLEPYNFLRWGIETPSFLAYALSAVYILALFGVLIGYKIRISWVLVFFLGGAIIPFSLEIFVKNIINFYAIFLPASYWYGKRPEENSTMISWPLILMGISVTALSSAAGLYKLLDPIWQSGYGLYYSLNIPFFPSEKIWPLLNYEWFMLTGNWLAVLIEIIALPLFLWRRTRFLGILCVIGLGLFLTTAMQGIGLMGGPVILSIGLVLSALVRVPEMLESKLIKLNEILSKKSFKPNKLDKSLVLPLLLAWLTITGFIYRFYEASVNKLNYSPARYGSYNVTTAPIFDTKGAMYVRLNYIKNFLSYTRPPIDWEYTWSIPLFDYHHLFDRIYFRVILNDSKGESYEPIEFFSSKGALSSSYPLFGNEKFILTSFHIMDDVRNAKLIRENQISQKLTSELNGLILYAADYSKHIDFVSGTIAVKPIFQPYTYKGNYKEWEQEDWIDFYFFDMKNEVGQLENKIPVYDYSKLEIVPFKNKVITPNF
ncbi:hypothetical protein [uncultured Dokdonia sp.]|uniref:hypothetical protein n=1 Tax=uncultured Dokdonia sp. TaxID=575653 RepID=UPI0030EB6BED